MCVDQEKLVAPEGRVDPAWQRVCVARLGLEHSQVVEAGLDDTLSWLRKKFGASVRRAGRPKSKIDIPILFSSTV